MGELVSDSSFLRWIQNYRCSRCWGMLSAKFAPEHKVEIFCNNENCDGTGFVTIGYIDRAKNRDLVDYYDAKTNLWDLLGLPKDTRSKEELIKSLGF